MLSPIHSLLPRVLQSYSTDPPYNLTSYSDWSQSYLTMPHGPHPISSKVMTKTTVGTHPHSLRDVDALQGHMAIMWRSCNHVLPMPPCHQATWPVDLGPEGPNPLSFPSIFIILHG